MELKIESQEKLVQHLSTFLNAEEVDLTLEVILHEFHRGLEWVKTKAVPPAHISECMEEGDGTYNLTIDGIQYRVTINNAIPTCYVARRTGTGTSVCPGWFGRIKRALRRVGVTLNERRINKIFNCVNQYTRMLKSQ